MALKGTNAVIKTATTSGGVYTTVAQLHQASVKVNGNNVDVTKFSDSFIRRLQALKDTQYTLSGFYDPTDTTGQMRIRDVLVNDTDLFIEILYDGTHGYKQQVVVASFDVSAEVAGTQPISIELVGNGGSITVL